MDEKTPLPVENQAAGAALNQLLASATLPDGTPLQAAAEVRVKATTWPPGGDAQPEYKEELHIEVDSPHAGSRPIDVGNAVNAVLSQIPALDSRVQFESDGEHAEIMKGKLAELIKAGANVPENYLEWGGFKPGVEDTDSWRNALGMHTLDIDENPTDITVQIMVPMGKDDRANSKDILAKIEANIKDRLTIIKETLAQRIAKYEGAETEEAKAAIKEKVDTLEFKINTREYVDNGDYIRNANINIRIQSPEQLAQEGKPGGFGGLSEQETEALAATNPLTSLTVEQTGKALGRALLLSGDTAQEIFPKVAGREDMKRALAGALEKFKTQKPELAETVDSFLADDTFKNNQTWGRPADDKPELESRPRIYTGDDGKVHIAFELPKGQSYEVIQSLAAMDAPQQAQQPAAVTNAQTGMGAALSPDAQKKAMQAAIDHVLAQQPAGTGR